MVDVTPAYNPARYCSCTCLPFLAAIEVSCLAGRMQRNVAHHHLIRHCCSRRAASKRFRRFQCRTCIGRLVKHLPFTRRTNELTVRAFFSRSSPASLESNRRQATLNAVRTSPTNIGTPIANDIGKSNRAVVHGLPNQRCGHERAASHLTRG